MNRVRVLNARVFIFVIPFPVAGMLIASRCCTVVTNTLRTRCTARQDVWSCRCPLSKLDGYGSFCLFQCRKDPKSSKCITMPHAKTLCQRSWLEVQQLACKAARISRHIHLLAEILPNAGPKNESSRCPLVSVQRFEGKNRSLADNFGDLRYSLEKRCFLICKAEL